MGTSGDITLDEATPSDLLIPAGSSNVTFRNPLAAPVEMQNLARNLKAQPGLADVRHVEVAYDSQQRSLDLLASFPNVVSVNIVGGMIRDLNGLLRVPKLERIAIDTYKSSARSLDVLPLVKTLVKLILTVAKDDDALHIAKCIRLERLHLFGWRCADLSLLHSLRLKELDVSGGGLESTDGLSGHMLEEGRFSYCARLKSVRDLNVQKLIIDTCNRLELSSLGKMRGLVILDLKGLRNVDQLDFVKYCKHLECLSIQGSRITSSNLNALLEARNLRRVFINRATKLVRALCMKRPQFFLSSGSGSVACSRGEWRDPREYYDVKLSVGPDSDTPEKLL